MAQPRQDNLKNGLDSSGISKRTGGSKEERDVIIIYTSRYLKV